MPVDFGKLNLNLDSLKENIQLGRVFLYFRLIWKLFPVELFNRANPVMSEGHEPGSYPFGGRLPSASEEAEDNRVEWSDEERISDLSLSQSSFAAHIRRFVRPRQSTQRLHGDKDRKRS